MVKYFKIRLGLLTMLQHSCRLPNFLFKSIVLIIKMQYPSSANKLLRKQITDKFRECIQTFINYLKLFNLNFL